MTADGKRKILMRLHARPGHLIRRLHQLSTAKFNERAKPFDLTQIQFGSLEVIEACPGIDQSELGRLVAFDRQTVSVVVRRLVEKGLIDRRRSNGRQSALYLTGAARAVIETMQQRVADLDDAILGELNEDERSRFMAALHKLVDHSDGVPDPE